MIERHVTPRLLSALADSPAVFLHGARQTGKTTLLRAVLDGPHPGDYVSLDDPFEQAAARADPVGFLQRYRGPVAIDEVQLAPGLYRAIKLLVDQDRTPGRFLLTGSANIMLLPELADALVGRVFIEQLWPLSQGEILGVRERFVDAVFTRDRLDLSALGRHPMPREQLLRRVARGGFPQPVLAESAEARRSWAASYLTTILQRDIRNLADIAGLESMPTLLALVAARATGLMNAAELARAAQMPQTTLKRYLALLVGSFAMQTLRPWSTNLGKRLVRSPKLLITDTGLMTYLLGADEDSLRWDDPRTGPMLENFVAMELRRQISWSEAKPALTHFRTPAGDEVDLVLETRRGDVVGIEVKSATVVGERDFRGLKVLAGLAGERFCQGIVLYTGTEAAPFGPQFCALPVSALWAWDQYCSLRRGVSDDPATAGR